MKRISEALARGREIKTLQNLTVPCARVRTSPNSPIKIKTNNKTMTNEEIQRVKEQIKNLIIDWEIDLVRMNFSDLRSHGLLNFDIKHKYQQVRLDTIDISNEFLYYTKETFDLYFQDDGTRDLIDFIGKKNKIIPPLYENALEYCGETFETRQLRPIHMLDGHHRAFVCFCSGLMKIPIVIVERVNKFSFPIDKWIFERTDKCFSAKSKNGEHRIELDNKLMEIKENIIYNNILEVGIIRKGNNFI